MKLIGLLLLLALALGACRDKSKKSEIVYATNPDKMIVGARDSAAVKTLVTMFMERMKAEHQDSALMLLRTIKPNSQPQGLNREEFVEAMKVLSQFPVADYTLEYVKFLSSENNEVKCRIQTPDNKSINLYFKPVRYIGRWSLCMKGLGDHSIE